MKSTQAATYFLTIMLTLSSCGMNSTPNTPPAQAKEPQIDLGQAGPRVQPLAIAQPVGGPPPTEFNTQVLDPGLVQPVAMDISKQGVMYIVGRKGSLYSYDIDSGNAAKLIGLVPVFFGLEDGLLGVALDPNFEQNRAIYLSYSPPTKVVSRVSRFVLKDDGTLDNASEKLIIEWPTQRATCCHVGGQIKFSPNGDLYIAVGDNSNPFASGYAPLNETRSVSGTIEKAYDAQRTSANTNDLRGKILRIRPNSAGGYTIPDGNLFAADSTHRPEIYTMGNRNPYRMAIDHDPNTNQSTLYWGEFGPDASTSSTAGPEGLDEINKTTTSGNFGWPYFMGNNRAYSKDGVFFNPTNIQNNSVNNTGASQLPNATGAWYSAIRSGHMVGFLYKDNNSTDPKRFPSFFNNKLIAWDFNNSKMLVLNPQDTAPVTAGYEILRPYTIDMAVDPRTNRIYALAMGSQNPEAGDTTGVLYAVNYGNATAPKAVINADKTKGPLPLTVNFNASGSFDPEGDALTYMWDFDSDGVVDSTQPQATFTYTTSNQYVATLKVKDSLNNVNSTNIRIDAGINSPVVTSTPSASGTVIDFGEPINWTVAVTDQEDGSTTNGNISCSDVNTEVVLNHITRPTEHAHTLASFTGCTGSFVLQKDDVSPDEDVYLSIVSTYQDSSNAVGAAVTTYQLNTKQAELWYTSSDGGVGEVRDEATTDVGGGRNIGSLKNNSWLRYKDIDLRGINSVLFRVATATSGGSIEARLGSPTGTLVGTAAVAAGKGWQDWGYTTMVLDPSVQTAGKNDIYLVFKGATGQDLFNLNWFKFEKAKAKKILVLSEAPAFVHDSIPAGQTLLKTLAENAGYQVHFAQKSDVGVNGGFFSASNLAQYSGIVFVNTTGDVLSLTEQSAMEQFIKSGKGFVGIHASTDTEYGWPWYNGLVGAYFNGHPAPQNANLLVDTTQPLNAGLPSVWRLYDEWYNFKNMQPGLIPLIKIDETSYTGGTMAGNHPVSWYRPYDGGRSWYTNLGHSKGTYTNPLFINHLNAGLKWALESTTPPTSPTNVSAAGVGYSSYTLNWTAATSNKGIKKYKVLHDSTVVQETTGTSVVINDLIPGTKYNVSVQAEDNDGNVSASTNPVVVNTMAAPSVAVSLKQKITGKCLDVAGASLSDGARVLQWTCNTSPNQLWKFESVGGGYFKLLASHSQKSLDARKENADMQQWGNGTGTNQQWKIVDAAGGFIKLISRFNGDAVALPNCTPTTVNGTVFQHVPSKEDDCQLFKIQ